MSSGAFASRNSFSTKAKFWNLSATQNRQACPRTKGKKSSFVCAWFAKWGEVILHLQIRDWSPMASHLLAFLLGVSFGNSLDDFADFDQVKAGALFAREYIAYKGELPTRLMLKMGKCRLNVYPLEVRSSKSHHLVLFHEKENLKPQMFTRILNTKNRMLRWQSNIPVCRQSPIIIYR